ncbi:MAG TPA: hypothetical protein VGO11_21630 [Chthoniobacteraceae bacterium]|jgi:hypothetical protein|nr:hypothetical protein [Chthoniobacteraceae bacterium]
MMCPRSFLFLALVILLPARMARADEFVLERALAREHHTTLKLTPEQIELVGRERKLILTEAQKASLARRVRRVPDVLGVESLGEPDCSCHISSAMWTANSEVTIWLDRLAYDPDGSKRYYEIRRTPGLFTANARGELFAGGRPVPWSAFEKAVLKSKDRDYIQLSRPPQEPEEFRKQADALWERKTFHRRL